jgi:hypothetical protein
LQGWLTISAQTDSLPETAISCLFEDCLFKPLGGCQKGLLGEFGKFPL